MDTLKARIDVIGFENPDLTARLQQALTGQGASWALFQVVPLSAPMTGDPMVEATVLALVPADRSLRSLEHAIEAISGDLSVVIAQAA